MHASGFLLNGKVLEVVHKVVRAFKKGLLNGEECGQKASSSQFSLKLFTAKADKIRVEPDSTVWIRKVKDPSSTTLNPF